jgi:hypothetical protein
MRKKRFTRPNNVRLLTQSNFVRISKEVNGQLFFEIGNEITTDIAEAVSIMMRIPNLDETVWENELPMDFDTVEPRRALYWLSGGDNEWVTLQNYNRPWAQCDIEYQEEFGFMVMSVLKKSKKLKDIKNGFIRYLNLPTLYEFALSQGYIRK